ncbi:DegT/DnrJ/EryC1/StrS family aminotransferase [Geobacter hydrogenophilus]|uniref:dTDP-4-dehydro-6-deoxyglucose aminotransferase n=1 Tax=Geobacter hydrogenophilus TaxID=40983 RepID=A0A9W6G2F5_9BACT|nr:DegT/DnrJ/EryC1/StrS family aminotransferase [Geobacter hydrogenophilus]GLI39679.1 dTDP-4-dehydro-6-deoxyglucose aminotransferase [Geobacter hydrogenophilus]
MKDSSELAILGGTPAFTNQLYVGRPNIGDRSAFMGRVNDILDRRWLTNNGICVQEFERRLEALLGVKHCIAMCNATVALEITIRALGMTGEVIVPSFTFVATPHSLQWQQITPVFCDIDPETHSIDPRRVESLITPRTTGIIGVHLWGKPCAIEALTEIAHRRNLRMLFDAAHAFGCSHNGRMIGSFGDAEVFSFHATKFFNTFEGGAVATNDDELAARIRLMKNFGFAGYDTVVYIGTNGKMSEISAAMGLTSLEHLEEFIAINRRNYAAYASGLADLPGVRLVPLEGTDRYNYQYVVIEINEQAAGIHRDALLQALHAENIMARRYFYPGCHRMEPYRSYFPNAGLLLPETELLVQRVLSLPTGTAVTEEDIINICAIIRLVLENGVKVAKVLA